MSMSVIKGLPKLFQGRKTRARGVLVFSWRLDPNFSAVAIFHRPAFLQHGNSVTAIAWIVPMVCLALLWAKPGLGEPILSRVERKFSRFAQNRRLAVLGIGA